MTRESDKQIKAGALLSYLTIFVNIVSGLIYTPWVLHNIGDSNYGLYTLAISLISIFVMDFGVSAAVTRYVSMFLAKGQKEKADSFIGFAYKCYAFIDIIVAIVLIAVYFLLGIIYHKLTAFELGNFKVIYLIVATYNVIQFPFVNLDGILSANEKFIQLKVADLLNKLFVVGTTVFALCSGGGLYALVTINAIGGLLTIVIKLILVHRYTESRAIWRIDKDIKIKEVVGFSAWSTSISIANRCIFLITPTILGALSGTTSITLFGFSSTLENYVFSIAYALNGLFLPKVTRISVSNTRESDLLALMIRVGRIQLHVMGLIIVGFLVVGDLFINKVWLGSGYEKLYIATIFLILPSYFNLPQQIASTAMTVENKVKSQAKVTIIMAAINIGLSIPLSASYGAMGACIAIFIAYSFRIVAMNFLYIRELNIDIKEFFASTFIKISPWHLVTIIFGLIIRRVIPITNGKLIFLVTSTAIVFVYTFLSFCFSMNADERSAIRKILKRKVKK